MHPIVPYFDPPNFTIAGHVIHLFGVLVVIAVIVGIVIAMRRVRREGLDPSIAENLIIAAIVPGFVLAHAFDMIAYHPDRVRQDPLELLRFWGSLSSFGGIFGGILGMLVFFAFAARTLDRDARLRYLDTVVYGFSFGWIFGRLGCTVAFDHPGRISDFVLATRLDTHAARLRVRQAYLEAGLGAELPGDASLSMRGFHNLGFYELLYTALVLVPIVYAKGRVPQRPGYILWLFFAAYAPMRFGLDFLRIGDATYAGLTPGQYASLGSMVVVALVNRRVR